MSLPLTLAARPGRPGLRRVAATALLAAASAALLPGLAGAQPAPPPPPPHGMAHGGPGGHGGPGFFGGSPRHLERMLDRIGATEQQRSQIKQILAAAEPGMQADREAGRALREKARAVFTAPTLDANAAEQLRLQMVAQHDQASRKHLQVMLDVAQVLTPEQRAKIGERMAQAGERWRHRGERPPQPKP
ncbi:Spy/CpxP family protein refolding chaperone [Piscinibacter sakaiensis]|uniref:Hypothetical membrane-anchored protein n=1 Tax=Piscinibacter sakaiensis TaxID=1547922 RepID=A0A0K8P6Z8_PISS1|nr:Spy/CpxP family protein refolding chaperone [Piscinibacter sakaiensis]GAP37995.1 hypothetical membrane-anchored protein [Piscinibacter sakaiensis]